MEAKLTPWNIERTKAHSPIVLEDDLAAPAPYGLRRETPNQSRSKEGAL